MNIYRYFVRFHGTFVKRLRGKNNYVVSQLLLLGLKIVKRRIDNRLHFIKVTDLYYECL